MIILSLVDLQHAPMDDTHVLLTPRQFDELTETPFGVSHGKCWKVGRLGRWYLVWYDGKNPCHDDHELHSRLIEVVR